MTKIPSVEERVEEFNKVFPLPRMLALSGGMGVQRDMMNDWLTQALTAERLGLLTELREYVDKTSYYDDWDCHVLDYEKIQPYLDEIIKSNSI